MVSPFYLTAFLSQLRAEGYSVFIARGKVPVAGVKPSEEAGERPGVNWYKEEELLAPSGGGVGSKATSTEHQWGQGKRLNADKPKREMSNQPMTADEEDLMLAMAISESLSASSTTSTPGTR
jgi:hypothetical protein